MQNINVIRISSKIDELFGRKIDLSDCPATDQPSFYSRALAALAIMMECGIDVDAAVKCITDGYHDMGIDAIYCDNIQKKLVLVQSKWRSDGAGGISQEEILTFVEGIKRIITLELEGVNDKLKKNAPDITAAIKAMDYQVYCIFCHSGTVSISDFCMRPIQILLADVNDVGSEILAFQEYRQQDVFQFLASGQDVDNINIDDVVLSNWGTVDEPLKAYYGTIPAAALGEWFSQFGNHLFAKNIRFYKGSTDVNQGMRKVLLDSPENFFYYNNGIKILCNKITRKAAYSTNNKVGLFSLEGVSLVNGAQTTGTIGATFLEAPEQVAKAGVFVQLIDLEAADASYALQITKLSNTQNRIDNKEFAALDPEQERIKSELAFSNIYYLYKSGATVEDQEHQISLDEAIIAQACAQDDITYTATAKRNVGALAEDIHLPPYIVLFNRGTNSFSLKNNIEVMRAVEKYLQSHESDFQGRDRLALVHGNRFILHMILQQLKQTEGYNLKILDRTIIAHMVNTKCDELLPRIIESMNAVLPDAYPANIFKNVGRCRQVIEDMIN